MAEISAKAVMELREKTGVGIMDCKKALLEANGNEEEAVKILREKGLASAAKKASRIAAEGIVESYIHLGGKPMRSNSWFTILRCILPRQIPRI